MNLDHLSGSLIDTFEECELRYYAKYILKKPEPPPHPNTIMGKCLHWMFEGTTRKMMAGEKSSPSDFRDEACSRFRVATNLITTMDELTSNALRWGYFRNVAKTVTCEGKYEFKLEDGTNVVGVIDRLDLMPPKADILDLKTQKNEFDDRVLDKKWQSRIYNICVREAHKEITSAICISYWVLRHRVQRVWMYPQNAERDKVELMKVAQKIRDCKDPRPNPSGLCRWCPLYEECEAARK